MLFASSTLPQPMGLTRLQEETMEAVMWKACAPFKPVAPTSPIHKPVKSPLPLLRKSLKIKWMCEGLRDIATIAMKNTSWAIAAKKSNILART